MLLTLNFTIAYYLIFLNIIIIYIIIIIIIYSPKFLK